MDSPASRGGRSPISSRSREANHGGTDDSKDVSWASVAMEAPLQRVRQVKGEVRAGRSDSTAIGAMSGEEQALRLSIMQQERLRLLAVRSVRAHVGDRSLFSDDDEDVDQKFRDACHGSSCRARPGPDNQVRP